LLWNDQHEGGAPVVRSGPANGRNADLLCACATVQQRNCTTLAFTAPRARRAIANAISAGAAAQPLQVRVRAGGGEGGGGARITCGAFSQQVVFQQVE
jgi:hypothetical protein